MLSLAVLLAFKPAWRGELRGWGATVPLGALLGALIITAAVVAVSRERQTAPK